MGIEPTRRRASDASTALKTVERSAQPAHPQALSAGTATDYTRNDTKAVEVSAIDVDLAVVIGAWPTVPDAIKVVVLALVRMSTPLDRMDNEDRTP